MEWTATTPAIVVTPAKAGGGYYYEATWRVRYGTGKPKAVKRRLGKAWVVPDGTGWKKAPGRTPDGYLDPRTVHVAAAAKVAEHLETLEAEPEPTEWPLFKTVAWEWYEWKRDVKGATPATLYNDRCLLADPGTPAKRGDKTLDGRIMAEFADDPINEITPRRVAAWLRKLDAVPLEGRNVNRHRATVSAIYAYSQKPDTYGYTTNPVTPTDKRPETAKKDLDVYEWEELEAVARQLEAGVSRKRTRNTEPAELALRTLEDQQDANLIRYLFLGGFRLGEARASRVGDVELASDMAGGLVFVRTRLSHGEVIPGSKANANGRVIPIPEAAARVIARQQQQLAERFGREPADASLLFCSRKGGPLSDSAFRRRYKAACKAAGVRVLRLHDLRHTAGSHVARTAEATFVRDYLGHAKLSTTDRYTHSKLAAAGVAKVNEAFAAANEATRGTDAK